MKKILLIIGLLSSTNVLALSLDKKSSDCMAKLIYHEARGESTKGRAAIYHLVKNRIKSDIFPDSVCAVMVDPGQFPKHYKTAKISDKELFNEIKDSLSKFRMMKDPTNGSLFFRRHDARFSKKLESKIIKKAKVDDHVFFDLRD